MSLIVLYYTFIGGWGWLAGLNGNKANLSSSWAEIGIELGKRSNLQWDVKIVLTKFVDCSDAGAYKICHLQFVHTKAIVAVWFCTLPNNILKPAGTELDHARAFSC